MRPKTKRLMAPKNVGEFGSTHTSRYINAPSAKNTRKETSMISINIIHIDIVVSTG